MPVAENGGEKKGNHFPNDSITTCLACARLNCLGRPGYYHAVR